MKLWLIILQWNVVSGTVGPLPYDMAECLLKEVEAIQKFEAVPENRLGFKFLCEYRDHRLALGEVYSDPTP